MKRALVGLMAVSALSIGLAAGRPLDDPGQAVPETAELPWLVQLDLMRGGPDQYATPEKFSLAVGDWIALSASLPRSRGQGAWPYHFDHRIEGQALEQVATLQPGALRVGGLGSEDRRTFRFEPVTRTGGTEPPCVLLRAARAGKAVVLTTVSRGGSWKETRRFEIEVTTKHEEVEGVLQ